MLRPSVRSPALLAGALALAAAVLGAVAVPRYPTAGVWALAILAFPAAGAWATRRRPGSPAARRLLVAGIVAAAWYSAGMLLLLLYDGSGADRLWALNTLLVGLDIALPASVMALLATYPGGAADERPVRVAIGLGAALAVALPLVALLAGPDAPAAYVLVWNVELDVLPGPLDLGAPAALGGVLAAAHNSALALLALTGVVLLALRYRHAAPPQRVQIRWLALAGLLLAVDGVFTGVPSLNVVPAFVSIPLIGLFPILAAIGIVRPELLDVDEALRRSALFAVLWVAASLAYVGLAGALGFAAAARGAGAAVPVTFAATLAFHPVWQALIQRAGRRLFGGGLDGEELLRRLGEALEHTLEPRPLAQALVGTIREGMGVSWVRITLDGAPVAADGIGLDDAAEAALATDLEHDGAPLGRIECGPRLRGALRPADRRRLHTLGRQVGLAARNAALATELTERLEEIRRQAAELAASRARIVEAEERGRRRIERDIHDGIQQELVALIARIGLAEAQLRRDPSLLQDTLADLRSEAGQALADLRVLAGGIHPSVLDDGGIVDAIEARASRLPIGVTIACDTELRDTRFPQTVEGAAYFTVCEAFSNALKHSGAERVTVRLRRDGEVLEVEIADDGAGFDVARATGTGLAGLADRIDALRGSFTVESRPGAGTTLRAALPIAEGALHA